MTSSVDAFLEAHLGEFRASTSMPSIQLAVSETFVRNNMARLKELFGGRLWSCLARSNFSAAFYEEYPEHFLVTGMGFYFVVNPDISLNFLERYFPQAATIALQCQRRVNLDHVKLDSKSLTLLCANKYCGEKIFLELLDRPEFWENLDDSLIHTIFRNETISKECLEPRLASLLERSKSRGAIYRRAPTYEKITVLPKRLTLVIPLGYTKFYETLFPREIHIPEEKLDLFPPEQGDYPLRFLEEHFDRFNRVTTADYWLGVKSFPRTRAFEASVQREMGFAARLTLHGLTARVFAVINHSRNRLLEGVVNFCAPLNES